MPTGWSTRCGDARDDLRGPGKARIGMRSARWLAGREGRTAITEPSPAVMPANRDNKTMKTILTSALLAGVGLLAAGGASAADGDTLKTVKARGTLNCPGDIGSYLGFAEVDDKGIWKGIDIELCRAITTAIFDDATKVKIVPIDWAQRWPSLQSGDIDVVIKASGGTLSRDTELGLQFSNSYYLGTTKVMAHKELEPRRLKDADGGSICVPASTSTERQVTSYLRPRASPWRSSPSRRTKRWKPPISRAAATPMPSGGRFWPSRLGHPARPTPTSCCRTSSRYEPEVMIMRQGDDNWVDIANWTLSALLFAEQEGITSANVDEIKANAADCRKSASCSASTRAWARASGCRDDWAYNVIKKVGNYSRDLRAQPWPGLALQDAARSDRPVECGRRPVPLRLRLIGVVQSAAPDPGPVPSTSDSGGPHVRCSLWRRKSTRGAFPAGRVPEPSPLVVIVGTLTARANLAAQGMTSGFDFLSKATGWEMNFSLLSDQPNDPYWWFLLLGICQHPVPGLAGSLRARPLIGLAVGMMRSGQQPGGAAGLAPSTSRCSVTCR